jgi:rhomboid protease GluP
MARPKYPPVTTALVAINVAVFIAMALKGISPVNPTVDQLQKWGANFGPLSLINQPWRMLTSNYLHGGIIHLFFNMWCLWNLGNLAERIFERWTYLLTYTCCGLAGSLVSLWWHPMVTGVGASGAIFGMAGALIAVLYLGKLPVPKQAIQATLRSLLIFAGYNLFFGLGAGIDNSAHIGGLVMGLAIGGILAKHVAGEPEVRNQWRLYTFAAMALALLAGNTYVRKTNGYVVLRQSASEAFDRGNYGQAISDLHSYTERAPDDPLAHALLGASYLQKKQYDHAEQSLKRALAIKSDYPYAEYMLGIVYGETERYEDSRNILTKVVEQRPNDVPALLLLGYAQEKLGQVSEALASYQKAVSVNPASADAQRSLGHMLIKLGRTSEALPALKEAVRLDPQNSQAQSELGAAYAAQGMKAEAHAAWQKADELRRATPDSN